MYLRPAHNCAVLLHFEQNESVGHDERGYGEEYTALEGERAPYAHAPRVLTGRFVHEAGHLLSQLFQ